MIYPVSDHSRVTAPVMHSSRTAALVSVVIPNYNYGRYISEALESVLAQTHQDWEVIIVDDGSTDDSREVIRRYADRYPDRIAPIFQSNAGQAAAFNTGFSRTKGDIVCFLDSDDYWYPTKLARIVEEHASYDFVQHNLDRSGKPYRTFEYIDNHLQLMVEEGIFDFFVPTSGLSFKRKILEQIFPLPEDGLRICADAFITRMALYFTKVKCIEEVLGYYRVHGNNTFADTLQKRDPRIIFRILDLVNNRLRETGKPIIPYRKSFRDAVDEQAANSVQLTWEPVVSIITPSYNHAAYIEKTIECVASQDYPRIEHIVIDGGSNDGTIEILKRWTSKIYYVSEPDHGQSDAINKGFCMATGEIVAWLNSDDRYAAEDVISTVIDFFRQHPGVDVVYGTGDFVDSSGKVLREAYVHKYSKNLKFDFAWAVGILQPAVFFRKSVFQKVGYLDEENHSCMDYEFWVRLAHAGVTISYLDKKLAVALYHDDMKSVNMRGRQLRDIIKIGYWYYGFAHPRWLNVYAKYIVTQNAQIINPTSEMDSLPEVHSKIKRIERELFLVYNSSDEAVRAMLDKDLCDPAIARAALDEFHSQSRTPTTGFQTSTESEKSVAVRKTSPVADKFDVLYHPPFDNEVDFSDQVYRISWYLPENCEAKIRLLTTRNLQLLPPAPYFMDTEHRLPSNVSVTNNVGAELAEIEYALDKCRHVAIWKKRSGDVAAHISARNLRVAMVDKNDESRREAFEYVRLLHDLEAYPVRKARLERAAQRLKDCTAKYGKFRKSYVFGTGPSLREAMNYDYSDGLRIVCNSIVRNKALLEHIRPHIIVAADPLFHYGCSRYAEAFRKELFAARAAYGTDFIYPFFYSGLFECHYPESSAYSIPIPQEQSDRFNLDLANRFMLKGIDNVLTLLLLPVASTLTDEIYILGCDGRKPDENYFWKHDTQSQYNDLMDGIKQCHPGFFDHVVYEDYYEQHCNNLEALLSQGEALKKQYYSLTTTYIPALVKRAVQSKMKGASIGS